jgi:hypothetical protein
LDFQSDFLCVSNEQTTDRTRVVSAFVLTVPLEARSLARGERSDVGDAVVLCKSRHRPLGDALAPPIGGILNEGWGQ